MKKIIAFMMCAMFFATGCSQAAVPAVELVKETERHVSSAQPEITVEQVLNEYNSSRKAVTVQPEAEEANTSVTVMSCASKVADSYIIFPKVEGTAGELINSTICEKVMSRAEALGISVFADYSVEYNRHGIFSIRMFLYDLYCDSGACIDCIPMTFNTQTGELYRISDFFDSENQIWRGRIPDIITAQAADCQMALLSDLLPISDDRPFYITDEAVVIMYDLYEIATYAAGEPEFEIEVSDLAGCIDDASALNAMLPTPTPLPVQTTDAPLAEPTPAPEVTAEPAEQPTPAITPTPDAIEQPTEDVQPGETAEPAPMESETPEEPIAQALEEGPVAEEVQ